MIGTRAESESSRRALSSNEARPAASAGLAFLVYIFLVVALALGGGPLPSAWPAAIVQLASLPLLALAILKLLAGPLDPVARAGVALAAAIAAVPLLQLLPLPPALWTLLPGRGPIAALYAAAGIAPPWLPISLDPAATWRTMLTLAAGGAIFLATLKLDRRARRRATLILIAFALFSVLLGVAQVAQGGDFYALFANRNHLAALLYCALPFAAAWAVGSAADRRPQLLVSLALCLVAFLVLLLGIGVARSRAGLLISMLSVAACFALAARSKGEGPRRVRLVVFVAAAIGMFLVAQFAILRIVPRFEGMVGEDARLLFARTTFDAALHYLPFGSGVGTFPEVYASHQTLAEVAPYRVNHAHNDYLELFLEGGLLAAGLLAAFLAWLVWAGAKMWRAAAASQASALDGAIARAALIAIVALLLHSVVDYPLRTTSISVIFGFACALLVPAPDSSGERPRNARRRRASTRTPHMARETP